MTGRVATCLRLSPIVAVLALVACGGGDGGESTATTTAPPAEKLTLRAYFLRDGKVQPVARELPRTTAVAGAALGLLAGGPTARERNDLGLTSALPEPGGDRLELRDGVLHFDSRASYTRDALAQLVYTLTQFPTVKAVEVGGKRYTRADFEEETPLILVESPLPFQTVTSPLHANGTANTFEATFQYDLIDPEGRIAKHNFVTATSGNGVRGTFDFTQQFEVDKSGLGKLIVYEISAEDGRRTHLVEIPIDLQK
jgi:Immunoglobulin-like domain of bacterial spore germination/Sporulation and spore germination